MRELLVKGVSKSISNGMNNTGLVRNTETVKTIFAAQIQTVPSLLQGKEPFALACKHKKWTNIAAVKSSKQRPCLFLVGCIVTESSNTYRLMLETAP